MWASSELSLIEDLERALAPLGGVNVIEREEGSRSEFTYIIEAERGNLGLMFEGNKLWGEGETYSLRCKEKSNVIFVARQALSKHQFFEVKDILKHPLFEPISVAGYVFLGIAVFFFGIIAIYGEPDFEAQIRGVPLALLSVCFSCALVAKFTGIGFVWRRMNTVFPDPVSLNTIALLLAVFQGLALLIFL